MRPDVAALVYRLPEPLRPIVHAEVKGRKPDDQKAHITAAYGGLLAEVVDATAYLADEAKRRAHAAASRPGAMKGATSQRRNPVDPAGARWKPDYRGPLNRDVFPKWGKVPVYVPPLVRSMSPPVAKTIIVIGDVVDHQGEFVLPRATHAERIGNSPSNAHAAMKTLEAAGLVKVKIRGNRTQATVWRYAGVAEVDIDHARKTLQAAKSRSTRRVTAAMLAASLAG